MASPRGQERAIGISGRAYQSLLRAYPRELRNEYGDEMARCFRDLCRDELQDGGGLGLAALWAHTVPELLYTALKERITMLDILNRNAYRSAIGIVLVAAFILLIPLLAMQITDEVAWNLFDFAFAAALLVGTGLVFELVARKAGNVAYRAATGVALAAAFILVWMNLAVGIIGTEDDRANLMHAGVLAVGVIGAIIARFRPHGMARALFATALAQALVAVIAVIAGLTSAVSPWYEIVGVTGIFVALFATSAMLFRYAAQEQAFVSAKPKG